MHHAALGSLGTHLAELGTEGTTTVHHAALGSFGTHLTELRTEGTTTVHHAALGSLALAVELRTEGTTLTLALKLGTKGTTTFALAFELGSLALATLGESFLHSILLILIELTVLVSVELGHESSLASFHESLAIHLRSGGGSRSYNRSDLRSRGGSNLGLSLLSEHRESSHEGDDEVLLHIIS